MERTCDELGLVFRRACHDTKDGFYNGTLLSRGELLEQLAYAALGLFVLVERQPIKASLHMVGDVRERCVLLLGGSDGEPLFGL